MNINAKQLTKVKISREYFILIILAGFMLSYTGVGILALTSGSIYGLTLTPVESALFVGVGLMFMLIYTLIALVITHKYDTFKNRTKLWANYYSLIKLAVPVDFITGLFLTHSVTSAIGLTTIMVVGLGFLTDIFEYLAESSKKSITIAIISMLIYATVLISPILLFNINLYQ